MGQRSAHAGRLHEATQDGYRHIASRDGDRVGLFTRKKFILLIPVVGAQNIVHHGRTSASIDDAVVLIRGSGDCRV